MAEKALASFHGHKNNSDFACFHLNYPLNYGFEAMGFSVNLCRGIVRKDADQAGVSFALHWLEQRCLCVALSVWLRTSRRRRRVRLDAMKQLSELEALLDVDAVWSLGRCLSTLRVK